MNYPLVDSPLADSPLVDCPLIRITPEDFDVTLDILYATSQNFTGKPVYKNAYCYIHKDMLPHLQQAIANANSLGYQLKIFDAFRPTEAQEILWESFPNADYVADPKKGSLHSRGIAIDLTLIDRATGKELEMGTPFDDFRKEAHHFAPNISQEAKHNRFVLMGIMLSAGWARIKTEWWHYQHPDIRNFPLISDGRLPAEGRIMSLSPLRQTAFR